MDPVSSYAAPQIQLETRPWQIDGQTPRPRPPRLQPASAASLARCGTSTALRTRPQCQQVGSRHVPTPITSLQGAHRPGSTKKNYGRAPSVAQNTNTIGTPAPDMFRVAAHTTIHPAVPPRPSGGTVTDLGCSPALSDCQTIHWAHPHCGGRRNLASTLTFSASG